MRWFRGGARVSALVPALLLSAALARPAAAAVPAAAVSVLPIKDDAATSDADKRAKAIECSKQADAKHLHGDARLKFRAACKDKSST